MSIDPAAGSNAASTNLSLSFYRELTINRRDSLFFVPPTRAIATSMIYASITVLLAIILGFPASWLLARNHESRFSRLFEPIPYVSEAGMARVLADLAADDPRLAGRQASEWLDASYLRELEAAGFGQP